MRPNRMLMILGGCLLAGSAARADELGYIDCASHNDTTPVFAKARKSQDVVANVPCGERFKVLVYGFVFSEIQTSDGKVGFIYSNVMTADRSGGTLQSRANSTSSTPNLSSASEKTKIYAEPKETAAPVQSQQAAPPVTSPAPVTNTAASAPAPSNPSVVNDSGVRGAVIDAPAPVKPAKNSASAPATLPGPAAVLQATSTSGTSTEAPVSSAAAAPASARPNQTPTSAPAVTPPATVEAAPAPAAAAGATIADLEAAASAKLATPASQTTPAPAATSSSAPATDAPPAMDAAKPEVTAATDATTAAATQPQPGAEAQPQPEAPAPVEAVKPAKQQRWEKPNYGAKSASLLELFGGFAFARMNNSGSYSNGLNFPGAMGSFAVNVKPWIQIVGDTSYNFQNSNGVKNIVYGNHYGARIFARGKTRWNLAPFGEVLVGGSRADTTVAATPGYPAYTTSTNCFSIKGGGGVDVHPTKMFSIRLIDVDYYRTSFGTNLHQNNYWVSTGIVIKLMRGWWE